MLDDNDKSNSGNWRGNETYLSEEWTLPLEKTKGQVIDQCVYFSDNDRLVTNYASG